jgi:hypothetical protein
MSYYTRVEFHFANGPPEFDAVAEVARAHFDAERFGVDDIVALLRRGWANGVSEFNRMESSDLEGFMVRLSQRFPDYRMCVRGSGEEWRDYWLREFEGGKVTFRAGPFLDGKKPGFFRFFFGDEKNA